MMRILFWNTKNNININRYLIDIIYENKIDVIVLAEYLDNVNSLIEEISKKGFDYELCDSPGCKRIKIISRFKDFSPGYQNNYCSVQVMNNQLVLCGIHLPSRLHASADERSNVVRQIVSEIEDIEKKIGHNNTVLVGDMNDDPYEYSCIAADTFHGIPSYEEERGKSRVCQGKEYKFFYNPMWNFFGDQSYPPGTYYNVNNKMKSSYWYIFDQFLMRPHLRNLISKDDLRILYKTRRYKLIDEKQHPNIEISDHLPIMCELNVGGI